MDNKHYPQSMIDYASDKNGVKVEIEVKNLENPVIVAGKEMTSGIEYRFADNPSNTYGGCTYFQGEHLTEEEMRTCLNWAKNHLDEIRY